MEDRFIGPLRVELTGQQKQGRPIWSVIEPLEFQCVLDNVGHITTVPVGFKTDFASVPRIFWRLAPPGGLYAAAAVIHDWRYKHTIGDRLTADRIFLAAMRQAGVGWAQRSMIYRAVRMFGWRGWGS